jgi:YegS/Rv2252/BmrU family lipid kinase
MEFKYNKIAFVVNPNSRKGKMKYEFDNIILPFMRTKLNNRLYKVLYTTKSGEAEDLTMILMRDKCDLIISFGGDGTNNQVLNGIMNMLVHNDTVTMGIFPLGTGNDFARTIKYSNDVDNNCIRLCNMINKNLCNKIDLGLVNFYKNDDERERYFLNETSFGISTKIVKNVNKNNYVIFNDGLSYIYESLIQQIKYTANKVNLMIDGVHKVSIQKLTLISNGKYGGSGFNFNPTAKINDGLLNICIIKKPSFMKTLNLINKLKSGNHTMNNQIELYTCKKFEATCNKKLYLEMDGELLGNLPIKVNVCHRYLNFLV